MEIVQQVLCRFVCDEINLTPHQFPVACIHSFGAKTKALAHKIRSAMQAIVCFAFIFLCVLKFYLL